ncbi:MAG TPA: hypothetical protein VLO07_01510, partial [Thermoanaerobaculia bacterium]|nr:hypothetical protein [Thermoanaerobaculia bacterium]
TLSDGNLKLVVQSLPILVTVRLLSFFAIGVYRSLPGAFSLHDLVTIGKGVLISSVIFVTCLVLVVRFQYYSRTVMVIDGVLTLSGITFARIAVGSFREVFRGLAEPLGPRVLIVGAGSLGEAAARLLKTDENGRYRIVGFLDDSPDKIGRRLHGFPVLGPLDAAEDLIESEGVEVLVFASSKLARDKRAKLEDTGRRLSLETREIQLT